MNSSWWSRGVRSLYFFVLVVSVFTVVVVVALLGRDDSAPIVNSSNEDGGMTVRFIDRKGTVLTSSSTTPGTALLLQEVATSLGTSGEVRLTIDTELQEYVYGALKAVASERGYAGGAAVLMDVETGELLVLTSYAKENTELNRATSGLFVPGSIIKPFIAMAALSEGIIDPKEEILSTGSITLTDQTGKKLVYKDWKAHGYVAMREALGVSSNVYFYAIGGGYGRQTGLGIEKIAEYLRLFGIGEATGAIGLSEVAGQIPTPEWKQANFNGDAWRLGDTYLASIGQHGYEVTPLQMTKAVAALATAGDLVVPTILRTHGLAAEKRHLSLKDEDYTVVQEGMEYAVVNGTAAGLYLDNFSVAAKTGTAEADARKEHIHSWLIGYFPYDKPRYAFTFMLDTGPWGEEIGAVAVAAKIVAWIKENRPEYYERI